MIVYQHSPDWAIGKSINWFFVSIIMIFFYKENFTGKPKGCFSSFVDGTFIVFLLVQTNMSHLGGFIFEQNLCRFIETTYNFMNDFIGLI